MHDVGQRFWIQADQQYARGECQQQARFTPVKVGQLRDARIGHRAELHALVHPQCIRSHSTPMHKNIAPETKPCEIICTSAPSIASASNRKKPRVTKPICAIDEYATSFFISLCASATRPI